MRKRTVTKFLSLSLAFALVATTVVPGNLVLANAEEVAADETATVLAEDAQETATESAEEAENVKESETVKETEKTEQVSENSTKEEQAEDEKETSEDTKETEQSDESEEETEKDSDEESAEDAEAEEGELITPEKMPGELGGEEYVSSYINSKLAEALRNIYNSYSSATDVEMKDFKFKHLYQLDAIDFSVIPSTQAKAITDISGIGYIANAVFVDLSGTSIKSIPDNEFSGNKNLKAIILPDNMESLGAGTFSGCTALEVVTTSGTKATAASSQSLDGKLNVVTMSGNKISVHSKKNGSMTSTVTTVAANAIPTALTQTGMKASVFSGCTSLKSMSIKLTTGAAINNATAMFANCNNLTTVTFGKNIQTIPISFFEGAGVDSETGLTVQFETGSELNTISEKAFKCAKVPTLNLSDCKSLTRINDEAFTGMSKKRPTKITEDVDAIYVSANASINTLILPDSVTNTQGNKVTIGTEAFLGSGIKVIRTASSTDTTTVSIPSYVSSIGKAAFYRAKQMQKLALPASLTKIPAYSFAGCSNLKSVTVATNSAITAIDECAFFGTSSLANADFLINCTKLTRIGTQFESDKAEKDYLTKVEGLSYDYTKRDDFFKNKFKTPCYFEKTSAILGSYVFAESGIASATLPGSLTKIGVAAFAKTSKLAKVAWGNGANYTSEAAKGTVIEVQPFAFLEAGEKCNLIFIYPATDGASHSFGRNAFAGSGITSIYNPAYGESDINALPPTMTKLGFGAFSYCYDLPNMNISMTKAGGVPKLDENAFYDCPNLRSINLPEKLTAIPANFLAGCALAKMPGYIGNSYTDKKTGNNTYLKSIGKRAFYVSLEWENGVVDLSNLTALTNIGDAAFAYYDVDDKTTDKGQYFQYGEATKRIILPDESAHKDVLYFGKNPFNGAKITCMTTASRNAKEAEGNAYIPTYITESSAGQGMFSNTSIVTASWGFVAKPTAENTWYRIPASMFMNVKCTDFSKCTLPPAYLKEIGSIAYGGTTKMPTLDLTPFVNLEKIDDYAFVNCTGIEHIKLPNGKLTKVNDYAFLVGKNSKLTFVEDNASGKDSDYVSKLKSIEFGSVTEIGKWAFANKDLTTASSGHKVTSELTKLDFSNTKVTTIGEDAFAAHEKLTDLCFVNGSNSAPVTTIGPAAFIDSTALVGDSTTKTLTFPATLTDIGKQAFKGCPELYTIKFNQGLKTIGEQAFYQDRMLRTLSFGEGSKVETIGTQAFAECYKMGKTSDGKDNTKAMIDTLGGLKSVDFKNLTCLTTLGTKAFHKTPLVGAIDLSKTKLKKIESNTFYDCINVTNVVLNKELEYVGDGAFGGCIKLASIGVRPTTAMSASTFKGTCGFDSLNGAALEQKYTPIDKAEFSLTVIVDDPIQIGKGETEVFPYYICEYSSSLDKDNFPSLMIGSMDADSVADAYKYVKIRAKITDQNYYYRETKTKVKDVAGANIDKYYSDEANKIVTINGKKFQTFQIDGLDYTPNNQLIPLAAHFNLRFKYSNTDNYITKPISATYMIQVVPTKKNVYVALYNDKARTEPTTEIKANKDTGVSNGAVSLRACKTNTSGKVTYYYDLLRVTGSNYDPADCNIIMETSDPTIVVPNGTKMTGTDNKFKVTTPLKVGTKVSSATSGKTIILAPKSAGTATITIYPELFEQNKTTITVTVNDDIKTIKLSIPSANKTANPDDTFNVIESVTTYLGKSVSRSKETLGDLAKITDNKISFTSSDASVATVDGNGLVTVKSVTFAGKEIKLSAKTVGSDKNEVAAEVTYKVIYPTTKVGSAITTKTGDSIKVVTMPKKVSGVGTVTYMKPSADATDVVIPATYTRNGYTFKVTAIDPKAFTGNTTLKTIELGANITAIPDNAFKGCTALTKVVIPKKTKTIGAFAFSGCKKLKTVTFKKGCVLTTIGDNAFASCKALPSIKLPTKVKAIGKQTFFKCSKLKTVTIQSTKLSTVGDKAFKGIYKKAKIKVPKKKLSAYKKLLKGKGQGSKVKITK